MADPFLISPYFLDYILPFVLVFTLIFAILEKTKLLGDGKKQIDALVAGVVGLILIASPASEIVVLLMPFLAVSAVILLVFMLLYGFIHGKTEGDVLGKWWKIAFSIILVLGLVTVLLMISGCRPGIPVEEEEGFPIGVGEIYVGTDALEMNFLPDNPPNRVYEGQEINFLLELRNRGEPGVRCESTPHLQLAPTLEIQIHAAH